MKKFIRALVLIILTGICLFIGFVFYEDAYPTTLLKYEDPKVYSAFVKGHLVKGKVIHGTFTAAYNNLGTIKVRVTTFNRINYDIIVFQLREQGSSEWTVFNKYFTDVFPNGSLYPFGFPIISDSRGKTYEFEIYSVNGTVDNAIGFTRGYHSMASQYIFSKDELLQNKTTLKFFFVEKVKSLVFDVNLYLYLLCFFVPSLFIIFSYTRSQRRVRVFGIVCLFYLFFIYLFLPVAVNSNIIVYIAAICCFIAMRIQLSSGVFFATAFAMILLIPLYVAVGALGGANRYAVLVFFLMVDGMILLAKELYMPKKMKKV